MLLNEMFSAIGAPKEDQSEIDWLDDLKFYIDNDNSMLEKNIFPTVDKHKKFIDNPDAYKLYIAPIQRCCKSYCEQFQIKDSEKKFPDEKIIELAKHISKEQEKFIKRGDYDK
jgi:hypothetical protein